jgi:hypothetical protein
MRGGYRSPQLLSDRVTHWVVAYLRDFDRNHLLREAQACMQRESEHEQPAKRDHASSYANFLFVRPT